MMKNPNFLLPSGFLCTDFLCTIEIFELEISTQKLRLYQSMPRLKIRLKIKPIYITAAE